ncbi:hypothetical protein [Klebsiella pneumoniae IS43]|uniref:Uncharacterized protein n=1 Tax=Klebsiella pneumoniae IS43 TaxID=1432552 RepID=W1DPH5_KLEPN|nr:hypothetical protein [Klebsiella pneumoniae IS43]CDL62372.1 hypothetical protein [Klebsiella pneumoniae IS39]
MNKRGIPLDHRQNKPVEVVHSETERVPHFLNQFSLGCQYLV